MILIFLNETCSVKIFLNLYKARRYKKSLVAASTLKVYDTLNLLQPSEVPLNIEL